MLGHVVNVKHKMFLVFPENKRFLYSWHFIVHDVLQKDFCLSGFRKMTFTIHLIFTFLAGLIFRPLFSKFCSCFVLFFMLSTWYLTWCLMNFFLRKKYFRIHCNFLCITFLEAKNCLPHSLHVTAQDVFGILHMLSTRCIFVFSRE